MIKLFCSFLAVLFISSLSWAQMRLQLNTDLIPEYQQSFLNNELESNIKLEVPSYTSIPGDMKNFYRGLFLLGFLADVSFPMGSDDGFKHIAGTAFSGHVVASYFLSESFMLALRAGYIKFATQTTEGSELGYNYKYEDKFSQIPILFGAYYSFAAQGALRPYLGLALGVFFQTYAINWQETGFIDFSLDESFTNTGFGIVPAVGLYVLLGSMVLQAAVEYAAILSDVPAVEYNNYTYSLAKTAGTTQETSSDNSTEKPGYISVNLGLSFPLGSK